MPARADFTVEPFEEGNPGPHVHAAIDAAAELNPKMGPFGTSIEGSLDDVLDAVASLSKAAMAAGASRVSLNLTVVQ
jgi:uncharacterized protein YqgV (UPF0045/DUF77 family)